MSTLLKPSDGGTEASKTSDSDAVAPTGIGVSSSNPVIRQVVTWLCLVAGPVLVGVSYFPIIRAALQQQPWLLATFKEHYAAIFGLPSAALLSFILVIVFEARFDNIEMEIFNVVKFRGASGPIILWVLCFLSIASAIKLLW